MLPAFPHDALDHRLRHAEARSSDVHLASRSSGPTAGLNSSTSASGVAGPIGTRIVQVIPGDSCPHGDIAPDVALNSPPNPAGH